jgi:hypothetical protein
MDQEDQNLNPTKLSDEHKKKIIELYKDEINEKGSDKEEDEEMQKIQLDLLEMKMKDYYNFIEPNRKFE